MTNLKLDIDKSKTYILACSFGPDSMALLKTALDEGIKVVVAHVNYHKRDVSNFEQESLTDFCKKNGIKIEVLDTTNLVASGNFQEWARELRYTFFSKLVKKYNADGVLVAHQMDDLIETYLMQQKRGNIVKNQGIAKENELFSVKIIRPLLSYTKQELKDFDDENGVPYSIDCSNLEDHYLRNKIRHEIVEKMTREEKEKMVEKIVQKNEEKTIPKTEYFLDEFLSFSTEKITALFDYFMTCCNEHIDISAKYISEIKKAFKNKPIVRFKISESVLLEKNYDFINFVNQKRLADYKYIFKDEFVNDFLQIDFKNGCEDRFDAKNNTIFVVKNLSLKDKYNISTYCCEVRRLFIDWKVPGYLREVWPGIFDEKGNLLYIPRYKKNFSDSHKSKFVIKTKYFLDFGC